MSNANYIKELAFNNTKFVALFGPKASGKTVFLKDLASQYPFIYHY